MQSSAKRAAALIAAFRFLFDRDRFRVATINTPV